MGSPLRGHHNTADLFHLRVKMLINDTCAKEYMYLGILRRRNTIQESRDLSSQVRDGDELLEKVLGEDVGVAFLLDVVGRDEHILGSEVQVGCSDRPDPPVGLAGEGLPLVVGRCCRDHLVPLLVMGPRRRRYQLGVNHCSCRTKIRYRLYTVKIHLLNDSFCS